MKDNNANNRTLKNIWLIAVLLLILALSSGTLLASVMKDYTPQEKNIIEIMSESKKLRKDFGKENLPFGASPSMDAYDEDAQWETETSVDIFKTVYTNADGDITVVSSNGDKVIAPGTDSDYTFTIKNTGNISLDYTIALEGIFSVSDDRLPVYVRLYRGEEYLIGSEDQWVKIDKMETVTETETLEQGSSHQYTFEWKWPYEQGADSMTGDDLDTAVSGDAYDTALGNIEFGADASFKLNITTTSTITAGAVPMTKGGLPLSVVFAALVAAAALALGSALWLLLLLCRRKIRIDGIIMPGYAGMIKLGRKKTEAAGSEFVFEKVHFGKHRLTTEDGKQCSFRLKSSGEGTAVAFEETANGMTIHVGRKIDELQLSFTDLGRSLKPDSRKWIAYDKDGNSYTPEGAGNAIS